MQRKLFRFAAAGSGLLCVGLMALCAVSYFRAIGVERTERAYWSSDELAWTNIYLIGCANGSLVSFSDREGEYLFSQKPFAERWERRYAWVTSEPRRELVPMGQLPDDPPDLAAFYDRSPRWVSESTTGSIFNLWFAIAVLAVLPVLYVSRRFLGRKRLPGV